MHVIQMYMFALLDPWPYLSRGIFGTLGILKAKEVCDSRLYYLTQFPLGKELFITVTKPK